MGVGAVEVQADVVGVAFHGFHVAEVGSHQAGEEVGGGEAVLPVGVVQVGGGFHAGVGVDFASGDLFFMAGGQREGQGSEGCDKKVLFHNV